MSVERKVVQIHLATNHPFEAYGETQTTPDELLEVIAQRARANEIPLNIGHDLTRSLNGRFISATVIDLEDGHKAVIAEVEVDEAAWDGFDRERESQGGSGGVSFSIVQYFAELQRLSRSSGDSTISISADANHFQESDVKSAARLLNELGQVEVGLLYQFADVPSCRIIIDYVQQLPASGWLSEGASVTTGVVASLLSTGIVSLISKATRRSSSGRSANADTSETTKDGASESLETQIELIIRLDSDGSVSKTLQIRTESEEVVGRAFALYGNALADVATNLVWDDLRNEWKSPNEETAR